jgi:glycosyltransferase involved in cell wall biosynthesis
VTIEKQADSLTIKILAVIEAIDVNAVAKNMLEFHRSAQDLKEKSQGSVAIETSLVTFDRTNDPTKSPSEFVAAARELGLKVEVIPERFRFDLRVIPTLSRIIEQSAPDIVVTHQVKSHLLMRLSRLWRRYPWVAFHHGYTRTKSRERVYNRMNRLSLPTAHGVVTVCQAFAQEIAKTGVPMERIFVQHNAIRPEPTASREEAQALKLQLGVAEGERIVLAIGRLSSEKAHIDLVSSFHLLREINPETKAKLVIVGDGPERQRLEVAARSYGINERVVFAGQISNVKPYYAAADVLALPSHSEGSPYVLLEAMAARLPVVATSVGGVPEMVKDEESALLVPARDPRAMAGAISRILADEQLARRLTMNASALIRTRYSPETYVRSLVEIYRGVISRAARRDAQAV